MARTLKSKIDMSKSLVANFVNKKSGLLEHLVPKKEIDFPDLPEYEKLIFKAECLELRASKLMKYAESCREKARDIIIKENNK